MLDALNDSLEVSNLISSTVKEANRYYNPNTSEYVFRLEYRVKVAPGERYTTSSHMEPLIDSILDRQLVRH